MRVLRAVGAWLRARPATLAIALTVLLVTVTAAILAGRNHVAILEWLGTGGAQLYTSGRVWTLVTYALVAIGPRSAILSIVAIVALCGLVEPRLGWRRTLLAWLVTTVLGGLIGLQVIDALGTIDVDWFPTGDALLFASPLAGAVGTAMAGSAALGPVGRRRLRLFTLLGLVVLVIAVGQPVYLVTAGAAIAGYAFGALALTRPSRPHWRRSGAYETRVLLAGGMAVLGIAPIIALWEPNRHTVLEPLTNALTQVGGAVGTTHACAREGAACHIASPIAGLSPVEVLMSVLPWLLFLLVAWGLWRGMRAAVWVGIVLNVMVAALIGYYWLIAPLDADGGGLAPPRTDASRFVVQVVLMLGVYVAAAIVLWRCRRTCELRPQRARVIRPLAAIAVTAVALILGYVGFVMSDPTAWSPAPTLAAAFADAPERLLPVALLIATPEAIVPQTPLASGVAWSIGPIFHLAVLAAVFRILTSGTVDEPELSRERVLELLHRGGGTPLSYMASWPGIRHWIDNESGACVPYRLERGCALVLASPFGAPGVPPVDIVARFALEADARGWIPAVYAAPATLESEFAAIGWRCLEVGEESIIRPRGWSMQGKKWQNVRTSVNRAAREGIEVRWSSYRELTVAQAQELRDMSTEWAGEKGLPEMGFTLGGLAELDDDNVRLALAIDGDGRIEAATSWLPMWLEGEIVGWTLDFMRRRPDGVNGVMEMLIAHVAERLHDEDIDVMSLSAAPLASTTSSSDERERTLDLLLNYLSSRLEPLYGFRSLLRFKQKFQPEMQPIVLAYADPVHLPAIGMALTQAYLPGVSVTQIATSLRRAAAEGESESTSAKAQ